MNIAFGIPFFICDLYSKKRGNVFWRKIAGRLRVVKLFPQSHTLVISFFLALLKILMHIESELN
jgi:hypothetical protein